MTIRTADRCLSGSGNCFRYGLRLHFNLFFLRAVWGLLLGRVQGLNYTISATRAVCINRHLLQNCLESSCQLRIMQPRSECLDYSSVATSPNSPRHMEYAVTLDRLTSWLRCTPGEYSVYPVQRVREPRESTVALVPAYHVVPTVLTVLTVCTASRHSLQPLAATALIPRYCPAVVKIEVNCRSQGHPISVLASRSFSPPDRSS